MRLLLLSDENKKEIESLAEFASRPENHYKLGVSTWVPGDRLEFVRHVNTFRVVFTITEGRGESFRHMSLSVPAKEKLPNPIVAFTLATWCGFTGGEVQEAVTVKPGPDWQIGANESDGCIIVAQKLPPHYDA